VVVSAVVALDACDGGGLCGLSVFSHVLFLSPCWVGVVGVGVYWLSSFYSAYCNYLTSRLQDGILHKDLHCLLYKLSTCAVDRYVIQYRIEMR
jgi:hypothetical protein